MFRATEAGDLKVVRRLRDMLEPLAGSQAADRVLHMMQAGESFTEVLNVAASAEFMRGMEANRERRGAAELCNLVQRLSMT
jgi:hypothetical protein